VTDRLVADRLAALIDQRSEANRRFFEAEAERLARLCHGMAERFARGGRLVALGASPAARSDARHVAVEFVHPVIVGKRALPALGLTAEGGALDRQVELIARPDDIAMAFGAGIAAALAGARERGCLTVGFGGSGAEWEFVPPTDDPAVAQELVETLYHVLWELVHVFLDHSSKSAGPGAGASTFLYPFLDQRDRDVEPLIDDVRRSILMKAEEIGALRKQTLIDNGDELFAAAEALQGVFEAGGEVLALGNGGSATDAMDLVADLHAAGRPAIDLTEDAPILTAVANDIGVDAIFSRQVIAYGLAGDALVALSTSGNSTNVIAALGEARKRGMVTIAYVGYDGGRIGSERLADHVVVTRSEHIPRIQEAQASAYHALCALLA
jgi:D-sedoheptulose 7-phosphate isomerase